MTNAVGSRPLSDSIHNEENKASGIKHDSSKTQGIGACLKSFEELLKSTLGRRCRILCFGDLVEIAYMHPNYPDFLAQEDVDENFG